ncbi:MAG: ATP-binding protein [Gammaproteobacteria bacterium]|nr:ATP-binding protein [Gammaproteobacteria bacterium]
MERESFDPEVAARGCCRAANHPQDVPGMIRMFRWFGDTPWFRRPRDLWREADAAVVRIAELGEALHAVVRAEPVDPVRRDRLLSRLATLNREAARAQSGFSNAIRESARSVRNLALMILVSVSLLLWLACGTVALRMHRRNLAAERALAVGEQRLRTLMNSTSDAIVSVFRDGRIALSNLAAERLFGLNRTELAGHRLGDLLAPESRPVLERAMEVMLEGDVTTTSGVRKLHGRRRDGTTFPLEMVCDAEDGRASAPAGAQSARCHRARGSGGEAGPGPEDGGRGSAHCGGRAQLQQPAHGGDRVAGDAGRGAGCSRKERRALLESALDAAERSAELTAHLLAFSRRQPLQPGPVDVNALVEGMRLLLDRSTPERIEISFRLGAGTGHARVDPVQLESALLNLVINAVHATPDSGRIRIETERWSVTDEDAWHRELSPGTYVLLRVRDSGEGIARRTCPVCSSRSSPPRNWGSGRGFGLSMVHGFVRQSGGHVQIDSAPGEGTTIELLLPAVASGSG